MKYQIVYLGEYNNNPVYLIGHDEQGKPLYREYCTSKKKPMSASTRALLASLMATVGNQPKVKYFSKDLN